MSPHRPSAKMRGHSPAAEQISLPMPAPSPKRRAADRTPEEAVKVAITRRAKPSAVPGHVKLALTLELPRPVAERLSERSAKGRTSTPSWLSC